MPQLNEIANVDFVEANVFDVLREMEAAGDRFDVIVLDPPRSRRIARA
jgi:23S rRNA (cytosine1962-C5)-methyltransferase